MDIKQQCITEYLTRVTGYRQLTKKYGVSKTTINKCMMIHQGIHNLRPTQKQVQYNNSSMDSSKQKRTAVHEKKGLKLNAGKTITGHLKIKNTLY